MLIKYLAVITFSVNIVLLALTITNAAMPLPDLNREISVYTQDVPEKFIYEHLQNFYFIYSQSNVEIDYKPSGDEELVTVKPFRIVCNNESCNEDYFDAYSFNTHFSKNVLKMDLPLYTYSDGKVSRNFDGIRVDIKGIYAETENETVGYSFDRVLKVYPDYNTGSVNVDISTPES